MEIKYLTQDNKFFWNRHEHEVTKLKKRPIISQWDSCLKRKNYEMKINLSEIQKLACICITEAMRSCPKVAIDVVLNFTPLHIVVEGVARSSTFKMIKKKTFGHKSQFSEVFSYMPK